MLWDTQNSRQAMNLNVFVPRAIATFQTGWLYFASTSIPLQQLDTKTSSLSVLESCKRCLMLLHICCVLICNWLWFSIMADIRVFKLVQMKKDCFHLKLPLLWLFPVSLSTSYFCVMESQEISSLLSQLGQDIIIFMFEGLKWGGISLLPQFWSMMKKKHIFLKEPSNVHSRRKMLDFPFFF